jgi:arsenite-transporting ATPase
VLLVSTDPASNVGQVFGIEIGNHITAVAAVPGLDALEIDPQAAAQAYRDRIVGPVRGLLPDDVVRGIEEQLSGACTTEIAAFDEFTALLDRCRADQDYDHIIFDTAPTGHTIRLLQLPGAWSGFLEEGKGDASCLGPLAGLEKQRSAVQGRRGCPGRPGAYPAGAGGPGPAGHPARSGAHPHRAGRHRPDAAIPGHQRRVARRRGRPRPAGRGPRHARAGRPGRHARGALTALPTDQIALKAFNLVGLDALRHLLGDSPPIEAGRAPRPRPRWCAASLAALVDDIAADGHGLVMLMGKGGVGKTTLAAAVAVELARRGLPVHLTTSDPAAHLAETLHGALEHLTVSRIDPHAETERYRAHMLATKGAQLDAAGRAVLEEDLRSPCTEEIAVFQAFSRIIREAGQEVRGDGHRAHRPHPAAARRHRRLPPRHRAPDGRTGVHFTTPMMQLQDPKQTKVLLVTLAETTPVLEAANLQADLRRAGIEPWAWIINNSVAAAGATSPLLRQRARNERSEIEAVATRHATAMPWCPCWQDEPVGVDRLEQLVLNRVPA